jgi:predicted dehydrogenase
MIAAARKSDRMLSVYHNRHWDGNILTILKHLKEIGRPFRWESFAGGYGRPRDWWRSDKQISGGIIFDWGAHYVEWMLQVMDYEMVEISGHRVREVWTETTNEDEVEAVVRFKGDAVGSHTESRLAAAGKPSIRICGTRGAITASHGSVTVHTVDRYGNKVDKSVRMEKRTYEKYYRNIRDHLLRGGELTITSEWARRVVQVLEYAYRSAERGRALKLKYP